MFIGYGQDKFGYRFYDLVKNKLVRSRYVFVMKDKTMKDIDKSRNPTQVYESLIDSDVTPSIMVHGEVEVEFQYDPPSAVAATHEDGSGDRVTIMVRRFERDLKPSIRYDPS